MRDDEIIVAQPAQKCCIVCPLLPFLWSKLLFRRLTPLRMLGCVVKVEADVSGGLRNENMSTAVKRCRGLAPLLP